MKRAEQKALKEVVEELREWIHESLNDLANEYSYSTDTKVKDRLDARRKAFWHVLDNIYLISAEEVP